MHVRKLQFRKASKQRRSESKGWLPTWSVDSSICSSGQSPYAYHEGKICMCTAFDWIEIWFHLDIFGLGCVLLLPLQCDSANEKPDIRLRNSSCSPKWLAAFVCSETSVLAKQASSAEAQVKNDCVHDKFTPVCAVLANHPMLTMKVKYTRLRLLDWNLISFGHIWFRVCATFSLAVW